MRESVSHLIREISSAIVLLQSIDTDEFVLFGICFDEEESPSDR